MVNEYCAQGLSLHLGKRQIIDNVSVALRGGEMTALIGPNGAGKSTLLRLLTGYLTPDSGTRHLAGKPLEAWSPEALSRRRAVMLQRTALQADWTVETVIAMGRSPWGATADPAVLAAVMAVTGCDGLAGRRYPGLSGGEQQRVQLARCLAQLWRDGAPHGCFSMSPPRRWTFTISSTCCVCSNGSPPAGNCTSAWCCMTLTSPPCGPTASCCSTRAIWSPRARRRRLSSSRLSIAGTERMSASSSTRTTRSPRFIWRHNPRAAQLESGSRRAYAFWQ